jgi:hypothetical protein
LRLAELAGVQLLPRWREPRNSKNWTVKRQIHYFCAWRLSVALLVSLVAVVVLS